MAYTVGSASVEIVPDFRRAQIEITKFFQSQPDKFTIPVRADVDEAQAKAAGAKMGKAVEEGAAKSRAEGDKAAIQAARVREQAINRAHGEALRIQAQMERAHDRAINSAHSEALRLRTQEERNAARERQNLIRDEEKIYQDYLRSQIVGLKKAQREASKQEKIRLQFEIDEREAMLAGRTQGGLVVRAMKEELRQSAGLITAVIGGILLAGAPVVAGAAIGLFGGIGAVAAAQNDELRQSWVGLWDEIKSGATADAAVLVPAYDRMAGSIGQSFQRMRPVVRDTFEELSPQVDSFSASLVRTAENALPGLTRAVQEGMPVTQGFGDLLERTGTGVSLFFDRITDHAPASGAVLRELGDSMESLLPLLGELVGEGAEAGAVILPLLTRSLQGALSVADALGGSLPTLLAGFLAFRAVQGTTRIITGWSQSLGMASIQGGAFSSQFGRAAGVLSGVKSLLPAVGTAVALLGAAMADSDRRTQDWTQALIEGGGAARKARQEMEEQGRVADTMNSGFIGLLGNITSMGVGWKIYGDDVDKAAAAHRDFLNSLTPVERAQHDLDVATRNLAEALKDEDITAGSLESKQAAVAAATARLASEQEKLQRATQGVTEAMAEQADAARARVDANFGYQQSVLDLQEAQVDLKKAMDATYDTEAEKIAAVEQATLDLNKAMQDQVTAAGELAMSNLPASMSDTQKSILGAKAELDELNKLVANGFVLPPSMEAYRQTLIGITGQADGAVLAQAQLIAALGEVGVAASAIPGTKAIEITAPTDQVIQRLLDLGFTVTSLPDGDVKVEAVTDEAKANLGSLSTDLANLDATTAKPGVTLVDKNFIGPVQASGTMLNNLTSTTAKPGVTLVDKNFIGPVQAANTSLSNLNRTTAVPTISINDQASGTLRIIKSGIDGIQSKTVSITVNSTTTYRQLGFQSNMPIGPKDGGAIENGRIAPLRKYDTGGAVIGPGGPRDDLIPAYGPEGRPNYRISNGEHIFDALDVLLMGGQSGVYAFREALNSRRFGSPGPDTAIRALAASRGLPEQAEPAATAPGDTVHLYTPDIPAAIRSLEAHRHQKAVLASPWRGR